jgi:hypothetical protein
MQWSSHLNFTITITPCRPLWFWVDGVSAFAMLFSVGCLNLMIITFLIYVGWWRWRGNHAFGFRGLVPLRSQLLTFCLLPSTFCVYCDVGIASRTMLAAELCLSIRSSFHWLHHPRGGLGTWVGAWGRGGRRKEYLWGRLCATMSGVVCVLQKARSCFPNSDFEVRRPARGLEFIRVLLCDW